MLGPSGAKTLGQHESARAEVLALIRTTARMPELRPLDLLDAIAEIEAGATPDWVGRDLGYLIGRWHFHNDAIQVHARNARRGEPAPEDDTDG